MIKMTLVYSVAGTVIETNSVIQADLYGIKVERYPLYVQHLVMAPPGCPSSEATPGHT